MSQRFATKRDGDEKLHCRVENKQDNAVSYPWNPSRRTRKCGRGVSDTRNCKRVRHRSAKARQT